jgi:hypothetical protein
MKRGSNCSNWIDDILKYDVNLIKPDYVFLIIGAHLSLRNEVDELYHKDG